MSVGRKGRVYHEARYFEAILCDYIRDASVIAPPNADKVADVRCIR